MQAIGTIVRQFHHVVKVALSVVPADLKHIHQPLVRAGDRFEFLNADKLALKRTLALESRSIDYLHRPKGADNAAGEPDLTVTARANAPDQLVFRHVGAILQRNIILLRSMWHPFRRITTLGL